MKSPRWLVPALLLVSMFTFAQSAPEYHQVNKFVLGGNGPGWDYLLYDTQGNRLFIARGMHVVVVDASTGKQIGEMPANGVHGTALVQDNNRGFFTNGRAGTVTVFDLKTLKPTGEIKVGENPDAIIYDPFSKHIIVMNGRSHNMMAIDPESLKVVGDVPLGGKLEFAAADAGHVYVNVEDLSQIAVVDSKTWKNTATWKLEGCEEPSGLAIDTAAHRLFAVCGNSKMVVVDSENGKIVATVDTGRGTDAAAFDPGLKLAFASNGEGTLSVVQTTGDNYKLLENVPTMRSARTMALDPKSHRIYLVGAELNPPPAGQRWPQEKPDTFTVLVYAPK
ncbi:MAG TPA: cytochrome D1 domain-containing protein [Terriglobales bacterium]|nr:cytochrome D1 domain-containing protein [Terriglobales bacterium]